MIRKALLTWLIFSILVISTSAQADLSKPIDFHWGRPAVEFEVDYDHARILVLGFAKALIKVRLAEGALNLGENNQASFIPISSLEVKSVESISQPDGHFEVSLVLPYGIDQIPFVVFDPDDPGKKINYLLNVKVEKNRVTVLTDNRKMKSEKWRLTGAVAVNMFSLSQSESLGSSHVSSINNAPRVEAEYNLNERYYLNADLMPVHAEGQLPSGSNFVFDETEFSILLGRYFDGDFSHKLNLSAEVAYKAQSTPFLLRDQSGNPEFATGAVNELDVGFRSQISIKRLNSLWFRLGFLYALVEAEQFGSTSNMVGGYFSLVDHYEFKSDLFLVGGINGEYNTFSFSAYDTQSASFVRSKVNEFQGAILIGLEYRL